MAWNTQYLTLGEASILGLGDDNHVNAASLEDKKEIYGKYNSPYTPGRGDTMFSEEIIEDWDSGICNSSNAVLQIALYTDLLEDKMYWEPIVEREINVRYFCIGNVSKHEPSYLDGRAHHLGDFIGNAAALATPFKGYKYSSTYTY